MGLLDGDIQDIIGDVLPDILTDGTFIKKERAPNGHGGFETRDISYPIKCAKVDDADVEKLGLPSGAVAILTPQKDQDFTPATDDAFTYGRKRYRVISVSEDPAAATWTVAGTEEKRA